MPGAGLAEAAWLAMLLAAPAAFNPVAARVFGAAKLGMLAPLAALLCAVLLGLANRGMFRLAGPARWAVPALAGFFGVAVLSTAASETPWIALFGNYDRREGLAAWLFAGLLCAAMLALMRSRAQVERAVDALLLGSVLPCVFALMQLTDWIAGPGHVSTRPGSTLGNPAFLSDYLLLVIPLTLARLLDHAPIRPAPPRQAWLALLLLQAAVLLLTQSRAPLIALTAGLWLFLVLVAGIRRSPRLFNAACAVLLAAVAALAALNVVPQLGAAARGVPGLARFVFSGDADPSSVSRIGIWQAGTQTLQAAPPLRQLIGYGPDAAHFHYFAHLPPEVLAIEGEFDTSDRLHNDTMELAATLGAAGLFCYLALLAALLRAAAAALTAGGAPARPPSWRWFGALPLATGALGAGIAAALSGQAGLAAVGFGAGLGAGWMLALARHAFLDMRQARPAPPGAMLIAALAASVLAFWIDAQVALPVLATRLVFFALLALLAILAGRDVDQPADAATDALAALGRAGFAGWCAGMIVIAATPGLMPAPFWQMATQPEPTLTYWITRLLILAAPVPAAWLLCGAARAEARAFVLALAFCIVPFAAGYFALAALQGLAPAGTQEQALAAPVLWSWLWLVCCCVITVRRLAPVRPSRSLRARLLPWIAGVLVIAALAGAWAELRGDVLSRLVGEALLRGKTDAVPALLERMRDALPGERQYTVAVGTRRLERTVAALNRGGLDRAQLNVLAAELRQAEAETRTALAQGPNDPWTVFALANVLQFEGLTALRPLMGAEGVDKAEEARRRFRQAHLMYPAQPVILRNWAQFEADQGDLAAAYRLLDQMEALAPAGEASYAERVRIARLAGDQATVAATLARAATRLKPEALERVRRASVAPGT